MSAKADRLRSRISIDPDTPIASPPVAPSTLVPVPAEPIKQQSPSVSSESIERHETADGGHQPGRPQSTRSAKTTTRSVAPWETALDDPRAIEGKNDYVSFYLPRRVKLRFAAAIYWSSRDRTGAGKVPLNMSNAITEFMEQTAQELEESYNDGHVFPPTPEQLKGYKNKRSSS
jgi:hypothetical protein